MAAISVTSKGQVTIPKRVRDALGITPEVARKLTDGGMGDIRTLAQGVDIDDVTEVLGGDRALAEQILAKAQTNVSSPAEE